jgi:hypothetical protein
MLCPGMVCVLCAVQGETRLDDIKMHGTTMKIVYLALS